MSNSMDFIVKYWSQIAVLIGAVGYLVKIPLDYSIKRREQGFNHQMTEQTRAISKFMTSFQAVSMNVKDMAISYLHENHTEVNSLKGRTLALVHEFQLSYSLLRLCLSKNEINLYHKIFIESAATIDRVMAAPTNRIDESILNETLRDMRAHEKLLGEAAEQFRKRFFPN